MKKALLTFSFLLFGVATLLANVPSEKVLKVFNSTFASPTDVTWYTHENSYEVSFLQEGIRSNVKYDKDGEFISSIRYYSEQNLPINIICQLKKKFPGKKVFGVTEMTSVEEVNYYVKLEDDKHWVTIKITGNGHLESIEKYKKA